MRAGAGRYGSKRMAMLLLKPDWVGWTWSSTHSALVRVERSGERDARATLSSHYDFMHA
jgi:hypothetical protein